MLQSVVVGNAQKVCSELSVEQCSDYEEVKGDLCSQLMSWCLSHTDRNLEIGNENRVTPMLITPKKRKFDLTGGIAPLVRRKTLVD